MEKKFGLISSDSHAQLPPDAFTSRMSKKWGDAIPQVRETSDPKHMAVRFDHPVERWFVNGKVVGVRGTSNCPTAMDDPLRKTFPQRWEEVPATVWDPEKRLAALDRDGIDGEVLFPNDPVQNPVGFIQLKDPAFEVECVRAYNDAMAEWREVSDRYAPLAVIPYMNDIDVVVKEVEHAVKKGHRGITILTEPRQTDPTLRHFQDSFWDPLWEVCQSLDVPIHWHGTAGLNKIEMPMWSGYTQNQKQAVAPLGHFIGQAQVIPNLIFSGLLDRYPRLRWVCAETGLGWVNYVLEACDHEWERRHLWTEGVLTRPSELFHRQVFVDFWFEATGVQLRHEIGMGNIMWESDYPHSTSTWPDSWSFVERSLAGVPENEKDQLIFGNAMKLYKF